MAVAPPGQTRPATLVPAAPGASAPADGRQYFTIESSILGETRRLFVSLPPSFERGTGTRRYPLLVVTDGEAHSATAAITASRELARHGLVPEFVIASVAVAALASAFSYFPDPGSYVPVTESLVGNLSQMLYPALVLSVGLVATIMRTTRSAFLEAANPGAVAAMRARFAALHEAGLWRPRRNSIVASLEDTA